MTGIVIEPGPRRGAVVAPPSKSHAHRLLIANFLSGIPVPADDANDADDILATKRCLRALADDLSDLRPLTSDLVLDCGESGSTLRFLAPIAAALGKTPTFVRRGRLANRPFKPYAALQSGLHTLPGDVSSQFVTGLLFALPLLKGDSKIRFTSPLESRGYVDMTLDVLHKAGVAVREVKVKGEGEEWNGFDIVGGQRYREQPMVVEGDWSGAAFWFAMNALGSDIQVSGLNPTSTQPDRAVRDALRACKAEGTIDVSPFPDIFPVLTVVAAAQNHPTRFVGIRRLRLKESDRIAAMADVLDRLGRRVEVTDESFVVHGAPGPFRGGDFTSCGDHRIAMSIAAGATFASSSVTIDDVSCAAKSYPAFFQQYHRLGAATIC